MINRKLTPFCKPIRRYKKGIAMMLAVLFLSEIVSPTAAWALTGGPSQPEVASFEPVSTNQMVDLFSGDFTYNIPLLDVEGYPINIAYHGGVKMEEEASWVGWGWNINPGVINRSIRGIPDDFNGDIIDQQISMRPEKTINAGVGFETELIGLKKLNPGSGEKRKWNPKATVGLDFVYNNYKGFYIAPTLSKSLNFQFNAGKKAKIRTRLNFSHNAANGLSVGASADLAFQEGQKSTVFGLGGATYNSRNQNINLSLRASFYLEDESKWNEHGRDYKEETEATSFSVPIGLATYVSTARPSSSQISGNIRFKFAAEVAGVQAGAHGEGTYSESSVNLVDDRQKKSYGYLYLQNRNKYDPHKNHSKSYYEAKADFSRDGNPNVFNPNMTYLAPANLTYDVLSINAQGTGGMFRPFRNDIGVVSDPSYYNKGLSGLSVGVEVGAGGYARFGGDGSVKISVDQGGDWAEQGHLDNYKFIQNSKGSLKENVYYKLGGEIVPVSETYHSLGGETPSQFDLLSQKELGGNNKLKYVVHYGKKAKSVSPRQPRGKVIQTVVAEDAQYSSLDRKIPNYPGEYPFNAQGPAISYVDRVSPNSGKEGHHISEIIQYETDGSRYVFGIPAYNNLKKEVIFNASRSLDNSKGDKTPDAQGNISYDAQDASTSNQRGRDNHFSETSTPPYAHSYLITGYLSPDYVDVTGDGITADDPGNAIKFNWTKVESEMGWRDPIGSMTASFHEGNEADLFDNKGTFVYGNKEIWHIQSIESRNYIAVFEIEDDPLKQRTDARGVDKNGNVQNKFSKKLKSIKLYAKENLDKDEPIKTIEFGYDQSLCKNAPNASSSGKLTLKSITIRHGRNSGAAFKPYTFEYYEDATIPGGSSVTDVEYDRAKLDKWGNYKGKNLMDGASELSKDDYPYVNQEVEKEISDSWAAVWNLKTINLPSGGKIDVEYESDDYSYVQDKRACSMIQVIGAGNGTSLSTSDELYKKQGRENNQNNFLYFKFPEKLHKELTNTSLQLTAADKNARIAKLFEGIEDLYFKFKVSTGRRNNFLDKNRNTISGYAKILSAGACELSPSGHSDQYGFIELKPMPVGSGGIRDVNPIVGTALQFFDRNLKDMVSPGGGIPHPKQGKGDALVKIVKKFGSIVPDLIQTITGPIKYMMVNGVSKNFERGESFIRLNSYGGKFGGGHRVSQIALSDEWSAASGQFNSSYGQVYEYWTVDENQQIISSGVASYEPLIGAEENPLRRPHPYLETKNRGVAPVWELNQELPLGESFYPPASVGYSRVIVKGLNHNKPSGQNFKENRFYTSKDFPVRFKATEINVKSPSAFAGKFKPPVGYWRSNSIYSATQGYSFVLNDMHGKPRSEINYGIYGGTTVLPLSGKRYYYKTTEEDSKTVLDNNVPAVLKDGNIGYVQIGKEMDVTIDSRQSFHLDKSDNLKGSTDVVPSLFGIPLPIPMILFLKEENKLQFSSAVVTKVIQNHGILDKIEEFDMNRTVTQSYTLYDGHTGKPLVSKVNNEYGQELFSTTLPAYWVEDYDLMGHAYKNIDFEALAGQKVVLFDNNCTAGPQFFNYMKNFVYEGLMDGFNGNINSYKTNHLASSNTDDLGSIFGYLMPKSVFVPGDEVIGDGHNTTTGKEKYWVINVLDAAQMKKLKEEIACSTSTITVNVDQHNRSNCDDVLDLAGFKSRLETLTGLDQDQSYVFVSKIIDYSQNQPASAQHVCDIIDQYLPTSTRSIDAFIGVGSLAEWGRMINSENRSSQNYSLNNSSELMVRILNDGPLMDLLMHFNQNTVGSSLSLDEKTDVLEAILTDEALLNYMECKLDYPGVLNLLSDLGCDKNTFDFIRYVLLNKDKVFVADEVKDPHNDPGELNGQGEGGPNMIDDRYPWLYFGAPTPAPLPNGSRTLKEYFVEPFSLPSDFWNLLIHQPETLPQIEFKKCAEPHIRARCNKQIPGAPEDPLTSTTYEVQDLGCCVFPNQTIDMTGMDLVIFANNRGDLPPDLEGKDVKIMRSGRRNQLGASVAQFSTFTNGPFAYNTSPGLPTYAQLNNYKTQKQVLSASANEYSQNWVSDRQFESNIIAVNPYIYGIRGNFRPSEQYFINSNRSSNSQAQGNDIPVLYVDGTYDNFTPYWDFDLFINRLKRNDPTHAEWNTAAVTDMYSAVNGSPLQIHNPLDASGTEIYSTELVGAYNKVTAVASNAKNNQVMFEDFESHTRPTYLTPHDGLYSYVKTHTSYGDDYFTDAQSHTGFWSMHIGGELYEDHSGDLTQYSGFSGYVQGDQSNFPDATVVTNATYNSVIPQSTTSGLKQVVTIKLNLEDLPNGFGDKYLKEGFKPADGPYVISGWIKDGFISDYVDELGVVSKHHTYKTGASFKINGGNGDIECLTDLDNAPFVEGWQRFNATFSVDRPSSGTPEITITINGGFFGVYIDDLRIYPADASVKGYVYEPLVMRLAAELDENNFATFYDYDEEGNLIRIRKETERGIKTIQESKKHSIK